MLNQGDKTYTVENQKLPEESAIGIIIGGRVSIERKIRGRYSNNNT